LTGFGGSAGGRACAVRPLDELPDDPPPDVDPPDVDPPDDPLLPDPDDGLRPTRSDPWFDASTSEAT